MKKLAIILSLFTLSCSAQSVKLRIKKGQPPVVIIPIVPVPGNTGAFTFTLASQSRTSAGVFKNDSILVKTLWNDSVITAGTYTKYWDGTNDYGVQLVNPDSLYKVKVLSNNVKYEWQGVIGNNSDSSTGQTVHRGYYTCMNGLAFTSTYGYFCNGYSEGIPSIAKFDITKPRQRIYIGTDRASNAATYFVATDGTKVYWAGYDANSKANTFVYANNCSDDSRVTFSSGVTYSTATGRAYNTIAKKNLTNSYITGLAVSSAYLFVAREAQNEIQVLDKSTGALVNTITITSPKQIAVDGSSLWVISSTSVSKYTVITGGALSAATLTLSGLVEPVSVSVGNSLVGICEANTQQVKFFNSSTGSLITTLGTSGGYTTEAAVNNNKFYFKDAVNGNESTFVAWQADGSYWVNDPGNYRVQHYNSSNTYTDRIMSLGATYSVSVDANDKTRVFAVSGKDLRCLEFSVDYSTQTLTGENGWVLVKNWGVAPTNYLMPKYNPLSVITMSNGRTYGMIDTTGKRVVVEFPSTGVLRIAGIGITGAQGKIICSDESLQGFSTIGGVLTVKRYPRTNFSSGNPVWSAIGEILVSASTNSSLGNSATNPLSQIFSTNRKVALYNYNTYSNTTGPIYSSGYHLGLMQQGATDSYIFQTEKSTFRNYAGEYVNAGWYDVGNKVNNNSGGNVNIIGRNIITSYHGEFWKDAQTNKFNHYYDNGLAIGQFGTTRFDNNNAIAGSGIAGNALTPVVAKDGDSIYLLHGDESDHAGIHRWKISKLNTIAEQVISLAYPSSYVAPSLGYTDLMSGLPFNDTLRNNTAGWTRSPVGNILANQYTNYFIVNTNKQAYIGKDIQIYAAVATTSTYYVNRDLGTNNVTSDWKISGEIAFPPGGNLNGTKSQAFIEVLDASDKILTTFYITATQVKFNTLTVATTSYNEVKHLLPFTILCNSGSLIFNYGSYPTVTTTISDATSNWRTPKNLRVRFVNTGIGTGPYPQVISLKDLKLFKDIL